MSEVITKLVIDCETGEQHVVPLTEEELAEREQMRLQAEAEQAARDLAEQEKAAAKQSAIEKLAALGLSDNEIAALVG
jgi:regulator of protease activity HflC (stomatin/prohibitin superfamily)